MIAARKLDWYIRGGLLVLVAVMPFHAFLSVWLGSILGHQALIQAWKELLTALLCVGTLALVVSQRQWWIFRQRSFQLIVAFILVATLVSAFTRPGLEAAIFGIKTDIEFLVLFGIATIVAQRQTAERASRLLIVAGAVVGVIALLLAWVLPHPFLTHFGYGPNTIQPYLMVDPAISTIRTPSTLGGPNQLGSFLILPLCLGVAAMVRKFRWWQPPVVAVCIIGIGLSYSRSAWLGAVAGLMVTVAVSLPWRRALVIIGGALAASAAAVGLASALTSFGTRLQYYVLHATAGTVDRNNSTVLHGTALKEGLARLMQHPWGEGLGSAGPASAYAATKVIPENYYLQVGLETGIVGVGLFLALCASLSVQLWRLREFAPAAALLGSLVGISVVNLFLHGWADSSTAFTWWILAGLVLGREKPHAAR